MMNLGINYLLAGPISEQFYIKKAEKTRYKNQGLYDQLSSEKERLTGELGELQKRYSQYTTGTPGTPGYAESSVKMREVESRMGQINARLGKLDADLKKESEGSTVYTDYQLLDKPPPQIRKTLIGLDERTRNRAEDILSNYGYSSKEFRNFAKGVKVGGGGTND